MRRFQCVLLAAVAVVGFASIASAADMPVKAAPMVAPVAAYSWTGFYLGIHAGGAWEMQNDPNFSQTPAGANTVFDPTSLGNVTQLGAVGGFQVGYNWQFAPTWVLGVEGDFSWANLNNSSTVPTLTSGGVPQVGHGVVMNSSLDWLSSARGRLGYVANNTLWYVTGGGAWDQITYSGNIVATSFNTRSIVVNQFNHTSSGWVAGGGVEYMATPHVLLRLEYLYYGLSSGTSVTAPCPLCGPGALNGPGNFTWGNANIQVVRAGLGYKF
jgi:outer membrane immunogenic protein